MKVFFNHKTSNKQNPLLQRTHVATKVGGLSNASAVKKVYEWNGTFLKISRVIEGTTEKVYMFITSVLYN